MYIDENDLMRAAADRLAVSDPKTGKPVFTNEQIRRIASAIAAVIMEFAQSAD